MSITTKKKWESYRYCFQIHRCCVIQIIEGYYLFGPTIYENKILSLDALNLHLLYYNVVDQVSSIPTIITVTQYTIIVIELYYYEPYEPQLFIRCSRLQSLLCIYGCRLSKI